MAKSIIEPTRSGVRKVEAMRTLHNRSVCTDTVMNMNKLISLSVTLAGYGSPEVHALTP